MKPLVQILIIFLLAFILFMSFLIKRKNIEISELQIKIDNIQISYNNLNITNKGYSKLLTTVYEDFKSYHSLNFELNNLVFEDQKYIGLIIPDDACDYCVSKTFYEITDFSDKYGFKNILVLGNKSDDYLTHLNIDKNISLNYEYRKVITNNYLPPGIDFPFVFFLDRSNKSFLTFAPDLFPEYSSEFYENILAELILQ